MNFMYCNAYDDGFYFLTMKLEFITEEHTYKTMLYKTMSYKTMFYNCFTFVLKT